MGGTPSKQYEEENRKRKEEEDRVRQTLENAIRRLDLNLDSWQHPGLSPLHPQSFINFEGNVFSGRLKKDKVTKNLGLLNDLRKAFDLTPLSRYPDTPYTEAELLETSADYIRASMAFRTGNRPYFTISKITRVDNTFHILQYNLMKNKHRSYFCSESLMFHGTKRAYLDSICTYNFDRSKVRTHKFGHGISFARNSFYATHYHHDNKRSRDKVMVIAQVFCGDIQSSTADMIIPRDSCYTSTNAKGNVIVKYDDASFYPLYIVYYEGLHPTNMNRPDHWLPLGF